MNLKPLIAALALALPGAGVLADTTDLGTLDASGTGFHKEFGRIFGFGSPLGAFTDYYTFNLVAPATGVAGDAEVSFTWVSTFFGGWVDLNLDSVSLYGSGGQLLGSSAPASFSFTGLSAGSYKLAVEGSFYGNNAATGYAGTVRSVASAAPEASSFAMALLGLVGVGLMVRRRQG